MTADQTPDPTPTAPRKLWKAALFVAGSIALSGVAIAFWNRGELSRLRKHGETAAPVESPGVEEEVF